MDIAIVTGSAGLVGFESCKLFDQKFDLIIGIDNDFRSFFFGKDSSTLANKNWLINNLNNYKHLDEDIGIVQKSVSFDSPIPPEAVGRRGDGCGDFIRGIFHNDPQIALLARVELRSSSSNGGG